MIVSDRCEPAFQVPLLTSDAMLSPLSPLSAPASRMFMEEAYWPLGAAGRVPLMFGPAATVWSNVQAGKLKALAVTQPTRASIAPDVPTMVEAGVEGYSAGIWMGLLAPSGTPPEIVDKLSRAANEALKSKEVLSLMERQGVDPLGGTPAEFGRFIDDELKKWDGVVKASGIKAP